MKRATHLNAATAGLALMLSVPLGAHASGNLLDQVRQGAATVQQAQQMRSGHHEASDGRAPAGQVPGKSGNNGGGGAACPAEKGLRSVNGDFNTQMRFVNDGPRALNIYWLDYQGKRVFYKTVPSRSAHTQSTFLTHPWVVTDDAQQCAGVYFPDDRERTVTLK